MSEAPVTPAVSPLPTLKQRMLHILIAETRRAADDNLLSVVQRKLDAMDVLVAALSTTAHKLDPAIDDENRARALYEASHDRDVWHSAYRETAAKLKTAEKRLALLTGIQASTPAPQPETEYLRGYATALIDAIAAIEYARTRGGEDDAARDGLTAAIFVLRNIKPPTHRTAAMKDELTAGAAPRREDAPPPNQVDESRSPDGDGHEKGSVVGSGTSEPEKPTAVAMNAGTELEGAQGKPATGEPRLSATSDVSSIVVEALGTAAGSEPADSQPTSSGARGPRDGWQPISSAPEGEWVLVWASGYLSPVSARRADPREVRFGWECSEGEELTPYENELPTHWMALPAAPGSEE